MVKKQHELEVHITSSPLPFPTINLSDSATNILRLSVSLIFPQVLISNSCARVFVLSFRSLPLLSSSLGCLILTLLRLIYIVEKYRKGA